MNIGITMGLDASKSLFSNGLRQNVLNLYSVLDLVDIVENVYIVNTNFKLSDDDFKKIDWIKDYNVIKWDADIINNIDVLMVLETVPAEVDLKYFKSRPGNKVIGYKGGNSFVMYMEDILFANRYGDETSKKSCLITTTLFDEIWMVPQQELHNKDFFEITHKCLAKSVPFIWSPKFILEQYDVFKQIGKNSPQFEEKIIDKWKVSSVEPNLSVLKNLLPILYIYEHAYNLNKDVFAEFCVTNAMKIVDNKTLISIVKSLEIDKDKKIIFDSRYSIVKILADYADIIVSNQWGNALNYAYLDIVYFGHPLIHNAHLCKDIGYYYKDFKLIDAAELVHKAINERLLDVNYTERNREIIKRYTIDNKEMINQYGLLLQNLYEPNEIKDKKYNWKTNLLDL